VPLRSTRKPGELFSVRIPGDERRTVLQKLGPVDINHLDKLDLTPRQRLAISQELEYQQLGLPPFSDPTPWQRLSRDQQIEFNTKYLGLPQDLQEYSRNQFLSLPEARQEKAYQTFLTVDIQTLTHAIAREFARERRVLDRQTEEEKERNHREILRRIREKKLQYSAMKVDNNVMMNHILGPEKEKEEVEMTTVENFISILKQQLSTSLQVVSNSKEEEVTVTTQLPSPSTWIAEPEQPRSLGVGRSQRRHNIPAQPSVRAPKSNFSLLSARASHSRKFLSKSPNSISEREKRLNIQRLMYDPRKKLLARARRAAKFVS